MECRLSLYGMEVDLHFLPHRMYLHMTRRWCYFWVHMCCGSLACDMTLPSSLTFHFCYWQTTNYLDVDSIMRSSASNECKRFGTCTRQMCKNFDFISSKNCIHWDDVVCSTWNRLSRCRYLLEARMELDMKRTNVMACMECVSFILRDYDYLFSI